jgi:hypothetical protein
MTNKERGSGWQISGDKERSKSAHPRKSVPPHRRRDARKRGIAGTGGGGLLFVVHFSRALGRLDLLELWKRAQSGRFRLAGAAARGGKQCEGRGDKCGDNADHGSLAARFYGKISLASGSDRRVPKLAAFPVAEITWMGPRMPACSGKERRSDSRRRRGVPRRRR